MIYAYFIVAILIFGLIYSLVFELEDDKNGKK